MEDPNEFTELLRQIMSREPNPILSKEVFKRAVIEMEVLQLVGERYVVWFN